MTIEEIILTFTYLGIFFLMTTNGAISFPSSQILYIICGYFIFTGDLSLSFVLLVGAVGNTLGNYMLYEVARTKGLEYVLKWKLFPEVAIAKAQKAFEKRGPLFLFLGKILPALKTIIPIPAGIAKMNRALFIVIVFVSSTLWAAIFIALGYFFGKSNDVYGVYVPFLFIVALIVIFIFYKFMNSEEIAKEMKNKKR